MREVGPQSLFTEPIETETELVIQNEGILQRRSLSNPHGGRDPLISGKAITINAYRPVLTI